MDLQIPSFPSASSNVKSQSPIFTYVFSAFLCALATMFTAFLISSHVLDNAKDAGGSDAGRVVLVGVASLSMSAILPLGILNALIIAPVIACPLNMKSKFYAPLLLNLMALLIMAAGVIFLLMLSSIFPNPISGDINFYLYFLFPFLIPPLFVGSLAYSLCKFLLLIFDSVTYS